MAAIAPFYGKAALPDATTSLSIKEVTRDDRLSAHRRPLQLLGIVPKNGTGFGNVIDAGRAYYHMEIGPLQWRLQEVNEWLGW